MTQDCRTDTENLLKAPRHIADELIGLYDANADRVTDANGNWYQALSLPSGRTFAIQHSSWRKAIDPQIGGSSLLLLRAMPENIENSLVNSQYRVLRLYTGCVVSDTYRSERVLRPITGFEFPNSFSHIEEEDAYLWPVVLHMLSRFQELTCGFKFTFTTTVQEVA